MVRQQYATFVWCHVLCGISSIVSLLAFALFHGLTYSQSSERDVSYFDTEFTSEPAQLSPVDPEAIREINQTEFQGFSFTNSDFLS